MSVIDVAPSVVARFVCVRSDDVVVPVPPTFLVEPAGECHVVVVFVVVHACIIQAAQGNARGSADIMVKKVKYFAS